jgi:hypothetical protein
MIKLPPFVRKPPIFAGAGLLVFCDPIRYNGDKCLKYGKPFELKGV